MKGLKNILFFLLFISFSVYANGHQAPKKESVIIDLFTRTRGVSSNHAEARRNGVIGRFMARWRFMKQILGLRYLLAGLFLCFTMNAYPQPL